MLNAKYYGYQLQCYLCRRSGSWGGPETFSHSDEAVPKSSGNRATRLRRRGERWRGGSLKRRFTRRLQEGEQRSALLPAGRRDGQQPLGKPTAGRAIRPEAALAPQ